MRKYFLHKGLHAVLVFLLIAALANCGNSQSSGSNEDKSNTSGNNNPSNENRGNHANEPHQQPGTNYPGSDDSARRADSLKNKP